MVAPAQPISNGMKYFAVTFFIIIFSAFGCLYLIKAGLYPTAIINSKIVWAYSLNKETKAAAYYYQKTTGASPDSREIKRAALENVIEKILIAEKLGRELKETELTASIKNSLDAHLNKPQLEPAAALLYGLNLKDFYNLVLVPQAEKEILENKLKEKGEDFNGWLQKAKQSANIVYITKEF